jgi:hypothetical protein
MPHQAQVVFPKEMQVSVLTIKRAAQCFSTVAFGNDGYASLGEGRNEAVVGNGIDMEFKRYTGANQTPNVFQLFFHKHTE